MADDIVALTLERAAADPAYRPQFAQALMTSTVFVMGEIKGEKPAIGTQALSSPDQASIDRDVEVQTQIDSSGRKVVPFFSSLEKMQIFIREDVKYVSMPTRALFELAKGSALVLNPGSPVTMRITPENAARILSETSDPRFQISDL
jgi:type III secretion system (T3SS) SseB-like protein